MTREALRETPAFLVSEGGNALSDSRGGPTPSRHNSRGNDMEPKNVLKLLDYTLNGALVIVALVAIGWAL